MTMRLHITPGLNGINHSLQRIGVAALQGEDLALTGVLSGVAAFRFDDLRSDRESDVVGGPGCEIGNAFELIRHIWGQTTRSIISSKRKQGNFK
jgi:hypothetical protein